MKSLPLSWSESQNSFNNSVTISRWKINWLAFNRIPTAEFIKNLKIERGPIHTDIIRGCNLEIKESLEEKGYYSTRIGSEAVLNTNTDHFNKNSLRSLIKRGLRHGKIIELNFTLKNKMKLEEFRKLSVHGNDPQLKNLFKVQFEKDNRLHIFVNKNNLWLGAILLSKNTKYKLHTELILRRNNSPIGIMEALVEYSFLWAAKNGFHYLSLGEVPFIVKKSEFQKLSNKMLLKICRTFSFAYNFNGLYNFKNKFQPNWKSVFICSNRKIGIKHLYFLFIYSNFNRLVIRKAKLKIVAVLASCI